MSTTVDQKVVEMRFDNKQFESNVSTTMSTLDKLKQSLNLTGATKGLDDVSSAAKNINMPGLGSAVESVQAKFSALGVMGVTALANITNSAVNAGKKMISALTVDPIKTGLSEYETQMNAVQTIMANTESKGTTLDDVNNALDTLNTYADKTIYNFTEMTRNIGTFTAAGVDLDTSVNAIQGIANLAAVSGSSSQQASTAMYQLSQALSSGTVKLMDWNSVVNAGMGGQVFQDALKETARVHGVAIDSMIEEEGSFRETLKDGWLTSEILTETLQKFTLTTEGLTEAQIEQNREMLRSKGYTEEQIDEIFKLGNTATNAATKVKTFTQLWDTLKETAQSGWSQTWKILLGDFEEAKTFFSDLYSTLAPVLEASAKARNDLLKGWKDAGGRADIIEALYNIIEGIGNVIKPVKEAFKEFFPPTTVDQLVGFTEGLKNLTERFKEFFKEGSDNSNNLKSTFRGLFAVLDIVKQAFGAIFELIKPLFGDFGSLSGGILETTASWGDWLVALNESIKTGDVFGKAVDKIREFLDKVKDALEKVKNFFKPIIEGIKEFGNSIYTIFTEISANASERLGPLSILGNFIKSIFIGLGKVIQKIFPFISAAATGIGNVLRDLMDRITSSIQGADYEGMFDLVNGGIISAIGIFIAKFIKSGGDLLDNAGGFLENINGILEGVSDALGAFTDSLKAETLKKIAISIGILAASLLVLSLIDSEKLTNALVAITTLFGELMGAMALFSKIIDGKKFKGITKIAAVMIGMAASIFILSLALKIMSTMSWKEMGVGLISLTTGLGLLVGAVNLLPDNKVQGAAKAIQKMSVAILILAVAIKLMSTMSWEEMGIGLITMVAALGALVGAVNLLPKDTAMRAAGMIGLATAMVILGAALKIMATMTWEEIGKGLVALAGSLAILAGAMALMKIALPGAIAMLVIAPALVILAGALKIMSSMSWEEIAKGLVALAGSLLIIAVAMKAMMVALPGAAALLVVSAALAILAPVLMLLGSMSMAEIGKSLLMLAGVFVVFGLAALVLQPLIGTMLALASAILLLGVACTAIGAGVLMIGLGLTAIAAAGSAAAVALVTIISSIISLIPYLIEQIGLGIIRLCEVIAGSASAICEAVTVIIIAVVDALVASVPHLVEGVLVLLVSILESLVEHLPTIVTLLVDLLVKLFTLLIDHIPTLAETIFTFIGAILESIASNINKLVEPMVALFGAIFEGIAAVVGPIIETVIAPILTVLSDLVVGIVEAIAPYIPELTEMFVVLATVISDAIVKIVETIAPFLPNIQAFAECVVNAFVTIITEISPIIDSITGLIKQLGDTISDIFTSIADVISSIGEAIGESLTALADVFDSVFNGISEVITSVGDSIQSVLDGIAGVIDSIGEAALNAGTGFENLANGVKTITELKLADMVASLAAVAAGVGDIASHASGISDVGSGMDQLADGVSKAESGIKGIASNVGLMTTRLSSASTAIADMVTEFNSASLSMKIVGGKLLSEIVAGIDSQKNRLIVSAKTSVNQFANAIKSQTVFVNNACSALASNGARAISDKAYLFKSSGKDLGSGLVIGINSKVISVYNAAYALGQAAVQGEKDGQASNSPSKLTILAGKWLGEGLIIGMEKMTSKVYDSGSDLGKAATGTISSTVSRIADMVNSDIDAQPTIRPVLDLSDVEDGVGAINGMFGAGAGLRVNSNVGAIASMMSQRNQNGANGDVVSAIDKLRKDLGKVGNTYNSIGGVTYEENSDVAEAIKVIVREARMERRR